MNRSFLTNFKNMVELDVIFYCLVILGSLSFGIIITNLDLVPALGQLIVLRTLFIQNH